MISKEKLMRSQRSASHWGHYISYKDACSKRRTDYGSCFGSFFSSELNDIAEGCGECWSMVQFPNVPYVIPYAEEIVGLFTSILRNLEIVSGPRSNSPLRAVYRIVDRDYTEPIHAFNVFLRHTWEKLHEWPIQGTPPTAKEVWLEHLDYEYWGNSSYRYIEHSNFCSATHDSIALGISPEYYVDTMYDIMNSRMGGFRFSARIPRYGDPLLKNQLFKMMTARYIHEHKNSVESYDPFMRG